MSKSTSSLTTSYNRISKSSQFDIDNIVVPYGFSFHHSVIEKPDPVVIHTPDWRSLSALFRSSSSEQVHMKKIVKGMSFSAQDVSQPYFQDEENTESSEENTDDEVFYQRHRPLEIRERSLAGNQCEEQARKNQFLLRRTFSAQLKNERDVKESVIQDTYLVTSEMNGPYEKELNGLSDQHLGNNSYCLLDKRKRSIPELYDCNTSNMWEVSPKKSKRGKIVLCFRLQSF